MIKVELEKIQVGQKASIKKLMVESDVISFSKTSEDFNPVHLDKAFLLEQIKQNKYPIALFLRSYYSSF